MMMMMMMMCCGSHGPFEFNVWAGQRVRTATWVHLPWLSLLYIFYYNNVHASLLSSLTLLWWWLLFLLYYSWAAHTVQLLNPYVSSIILVGSDNNNTTTTTDKRRREKKQQFMHRQPTTAMLCYHYYYVLQFHVLYIYHILSCCIWIYTLLHIHAHSMLNVYSIFFFIHSPTTTNTHTILFFFSLSLCLFALGPGLFRAISPKHIMFEHYYLLSEVWWIVFSSKVSFLSCISFMLFFFYFRSLCYVLFPICPEPGHPAFEMREREKKHNIDTGRVQMAHIRFWIWAILNSCYNYSFLMSFQGLFLLPHSPPPPLSLCLSFASLRSIYGIAWMSNSSCYGIISIIYYISCAFKQTIFERGFSLKLLLVAVAAAAAIAASSVEFVEQFASFFSEIFQIIRLCWISIRFHRMQVWKPLNDDIHTYMYTRVYACM